ncbi:cadherin domain-containing protein [Novosphingobium album (ex Liu et al. 2023)]|uniref:Ig-like domain-containing protein n=1 Tax=Novosphingobium album (ex Liu et al. 2023) TaxID=3031130 RepID=A0ABT5WN42_9SPHN|nr:Ig-like domain-containing protein [Novosphingobium album (ex Liu et al. 2023)]MDE8651299.1 Ig-like domain-containing protein [Novosphingobium album (ex Liu et al. 2023)]
MPSTTLRAGEAALISYETDATTGGSPDALRFVLLADIVAGTTIYITDRAWNGSAFTTAANDGTYTYTAGADLAAGAVITLSASQLSGVGITLSDLGETIYLYQGTDANTPTQFLFAADVADGNATFNGTLTGTGLTNGVNAVALGGDNAVYSGMPTQIQQSQILDIANSGHWFGSNTDDNPGTPYSEVLDTASDNAFVNPDMVMIAAMAGGGQSDAILRVGNDEASNVGSGLARLFRDNPAFNHLSDMAFDLENGYFFAVDSDGNDINRIIRGDIADLASGNPNPTFTQVFATDNLSNGGGSATPGEIIVNMEIDKAANKIYWMDGDIFGTYEGGFQLWEANYDGSGMRLVQTIDAENVDPNFSFPGGVGDFAVAGGFAYVVASTSSIDGLGNANVLQNHILKINLTSGAVQWLDLGDGVGEGYHDGRLDPTQGQIIGIDVDTATGNVWFVTQPISPTDHGGIFRFAQGGAVGDTVGGVLTEMWDQPAESAYSSIQAFPTSNMTHIEVDEIGGRYYVSDGSDTTIAESDASIFTGSLSAAPGTAPTLFVRVYEPTANGAPQGMEIDYAPVNSATGAGATFTEGGAGAAVFASATLTDPDNTVIQSATIAITDKFLVGDTLSTTVPGGFASSYDAATGLLTITGPGSAAQYQAMLTALTFSNSGDNPTLYGASQTREISFTTFDGLAHSDPVSATVTVVGVNDAPVNTVGAAAPGAEDAASIAVTGISIADVDADPANQALQVTLSVPKGTLTFASTTGLSFSTGDGTADASMTFTGTANAINTALAGLSFTPPADFNGSVSLTVTTSDQGHTGTGGALEDSDTKTITISAVNDAPTIAGDGSETIPSIFEDQPSATGQTINTLFSGQYSDQADNQIPNGGASSPGAFSGIAVTGNASSPSTGQWQWYDGTNWNLIGPVSDSTAQLFNNITALRFNPFANYNGPIPTLTVHLIDNSLPFSIMGGQVVDLSGPGATGGTTAYSAGTVTLGGTIDPVNDAPFVTALNTDSVSYTEQQGSPVQLDASGNAGITDIDSPDFNGGSLTVEITGGLQSAEDLLTIDTSGTVSVSGNAVSVSGTQIATFTGGSGTAPLVFTFDADATPAAVQALVRAIGYDNSADDTPTAGARTITWTLTDNDGTANGGAETTTVTSTVTVVPVNDAPAGADDTVTGAQDTAYTFAAADFGFSDVDGDAFAGVKITALPADGELRLSNVAVTLNQVIAISDITGGNLTFVPVAGESGTGYASFDFAVIDDGGTANGGIDTDATPNTITIDVTPADLAPAGADNTVTLNEDADYTFSASDFAFTDPDVGDTLQAVRIDTISLPSGSTLQLNNVDVVAAQVIAASDIANLVFTPAPDGSGSAYASFTFSVSDGTLFDPTPNTMTFDVTGLPDAPTITSNGGGASASVNVAENTTAVTTVVATDPDASTTLTYSISGGADAAKFTIDASTGALAFAAAPDFETPTDAGTNNVYDVQVTASDGTLTDVQSIAVTVTNANEAPTITSNGGGASASVNVAENTTAVTTVVATDPDASTTLTYSISGGADAAKFTIDASTGALAFAAAPDFETPTDGGTNNVYDVQVTASDGTLTDVQAIAVTVTNVNETPTITSNGGGASASVNVAENTTAVTTVVATDPDASTTLTYSISGGADAAKFTIDASTGALAFAAAPDFETPTDGGTNNVYDVQVTASDGTLTDVQVIAVTVTNTNEAPTITSNGGGASASINVAENTTAVTTVVATDPDASTTLTYSISGGADAAKFTIDASTGALAFAAAPDFETPTDGGTNNVYDVQVTASDGTLTDVQAIAVTVTNVNETPTITSNGGGASASVNVAENTTAVTTVVATDPDASTTLTYSISGGADAAKFTIDASTGALAFAAAPDFETPTDAGTNNVYDVQVTVSDGTLTDVQAIAVTVTDANEAPVITSNGGGASAAVNVAENSTAVTTVVATDQDLDTVTYSISGGADAAKFTIDASTGALAFAAAPDFETPTDGGTNNVYDVQVTASDGTLTDVQAIAVTVTNVNETPTITSNGGGATAAVNVAENTTAVTTVVATDPDASTTLTYSISGGADAAKFTIDASTGALVFAAAPNFESPTDAGGNNVYDVQVTASDGTLTDVQAIAVTVTDANEAPVITSNGGGASASVNVAENTTAVTTVIATDQDLDTVTYSISGGADAAKFSINAATGALAFVSTPNFESPTDVGGNNVYDVQVTASDGTLTDVQALAVTVTNVNEAPTVASPIADRSSPEDTAVSFTLPAGTFTDPDGTPLALTAKLAGGDPLPSWLSFNAASGTFSGQPPLNFNGSLDIRVTASDGSLVVSDTFTLTITPVNDAPVAGDDTLSTQRDVPVSVSFVSLLSNDFDPDADPISLVNVLGAEHGSVALSGGFVVFTPEAGFAGQAQFSYTITDGNGLTGMATVLVNVIAPPPVNHPPVIDPDTETLDTLVNTAIAFAVDATDADGDALAYALGSAAHGDLSQDGAGAFVYTPDAGFIGTDTFTVTVSDAKGGTDTYTATVHILPPDTADDWRLLTTDGWFGEIGGSGTVFGTEGFQDVTVLDLAGHVAFDPSFNNGGDLIHLAGSAADWHIARNGSNAILFDGDTLVTVPVGVVGMGIVFDDGARTLVFDTEDGVMMIGGQAFGQTLEQVLAAPEAGEPDDSGADGDAVASLLLDDGRSVEAGGHIDVFGTGDGEETVLLTYGDISFDPSFNNGGDRIVLDADAESFSAVRFGSSILLDGPGYDLAIPVGIAGMAIEFADDTRTLVYNPDNDTVMLGTQAIGLTAVPVSEFA